MQERQANAHHRAKAEDERQQNFWSYTHAVFDFPEKNVQSQEDESKNCE